MKDYYSILGIKKNATYYDITEAYRELSVTYHPDNHDGNLEFKEKYDDVQEAYETLSNGIKRREYDNYIIHLEKSIKEKNINAIPSIEFFRADKPEFEFGEEIVFSWKTLNADKITLVPFGPVQPIGSHTYKIKNYKNKLLTYELIAENTLNGRETKASLSLKNKNYDEFLNHFKKEVESQYQPPAQEPAEIHIKEVEKDHLPYIPRKRENETKKMVYPEAPQSAKEMKVETRRVPDKPKHQPKAKTEDSENNILLFIVILFLVVGISILIYLGFFM